MFSDSLIQTDSVHGQGVLPDTGKIIDIADFVGTFETLVLHDDNTINSWGTVVVERTERYVRRYTIHSVQNKSRVSIDISDADQTDAGIGANVWLSSLSMSSWIMNNSSCFQNKKILEIGCGVGLCSLMTAALQYDMSPISIVASDYTDGLKRNFDINKKINSATLHHNIEYKSLDWYDTFNSAYDTTAAMDGPYDVIIATDCIYKSTCTSFKQAVLTNLAIGGTLVMVNPVETSRPGVDGFIYSLAEFGDISVEHVQIVMNGMFKKTFMFIHFVRLC